MADEGLMNACAGPLLRYRRMIDAEQVSVFCDIKKKHSSHALTADVDVKETARAAQFFGADGVIVTGAATGSEADAGEVEEVAGEVELPVIVGSGVTSENVDKFARCSNAMIVGSFFKKDGDWRNDLDEKRMEKMAEALAKTRT